MTRIHFIALACAISAGCVAGPAQDDSPDLDAVESDLSIVPAAGGWVYGELTPVSGTCNGGVVHGESGPFTLDTVTTTSFRVIPNDGTIPFTCSYSNGQFNCPNRATATIDLRPTTDAVATVRVTATGAMSDSHHALGKQDAVVSCVGTGCGVIGPNPCGLIVNFSVHTP
jgi:hypothetical protein